MRKLSGLEKTIAVALLVVVLDGWMVGQIVGVSYRPFSWLAIAEAGVYPVITDVWIDTSGLQVTGEVNPGTGYILQKNTNLVEGGWWHDIPPAVTSGTSNASFTDTNSLPDHQFYRIKDFP